MKKPGCALAGKWHCIAPASRSMFIDLWSVVGAALLDVMRCLGSTASVRIVHCGSFGLAELAAMHMSILQ